MLKLGDIGGLCRQYTCYLSLTIGVIEYTSAIKLRPTFSRLYNVLFKVLRSSRVLKLGMNGAHDVSPTLSITWTLRAERRRDVNLPFETLNKFANGIVHTNTPARGLRDVSDTKLIAKQVDA